MVLSKHTGRRVVGFLLSIAPFFLGDVRNTNQLNKGAGKSGVPKSDPLPTMPDPNKDQAAKQAQADARNNDARRTRSLASSAVGDPSIAPTAAPALKSTLGGGPTQS